MENYSILIVSLASFIIIALASRQVGLYLRRISLPLISGFLITGVLVGPYGLDLISTETVESLRFIDEMALGFIAFAAGSELYLKDLRDRLKSIAWVTVGLVISTFTLGTAAILLLADYIPFMRALPLTGRLAIAVLGGSILVARSPSSAIAIVNELRAKGPFTRTILGVTVIMDVVVIVLFAVNSSLADALLANLPFNLGFVTLLILELATSAVYGFVLYILLQWVLSSRLGHWIKCAIVLLAGYSVFLLSDYIRSVSHAHWSYEILLEPLLICMIGGFLVSSFSNYRAEFTSIIEDLGPAIYVLFFTLTGASLALDVLLATWTITLALFAVRLVGIFVGSFSGGLLAGDPSKHNRLSWMAYVTQAGVGLGLAKEVAGEFPAWGSAFATVIISVIVINQFVGPPLFKNVLQRVKEAHPRAQATEFDGVRDAVIFGLMPQSVTLARRLLQHNWQVKLVCTPNDTYMQTSMPDFEVHAIEDVSLEAMRGLDMEHADALVSFLSEEESFRVCELAYEHYGTQTMVVLLEDWSYCEQFDALGVRVVEPQTAFVGLLEHFVVSPAGTSLLLGSEDGHEIVDLEMLNPNLQGVALRDLRLPLDVLVLSVHRGEKLLVSRGYLQFQLGDRVTLVGPSEKLEEVTLLFSA
jgi:Kef-type K+ transport system membrane component KefB/Trk K+ transport system NAD-binding subunit